MGAVLPLEGAPNAPIRQYWSITLYDRETHAFILNMPYTSRSSQTPGLRKSGDGLVDLFFGNWAPTGPTRRFEALARFSGPGPALFDHSWMLPDIERIT